MIVMIRLRTTCLLVAGAVTCTFLHAQTADSTTELATGTRISFEKPSSSARIASDLPEGGSSRGKPAQPTIRL